MYIIFRVHTFRKKLRRFSSRQLTSIYCIMYIIFGVRDFGRFSFAIGFQWGSVGRSVFLQALFSSRSIAVELAGAFDSWGTLSLGQTCRKGERRSDRYDTCPNGCYNARDEDLRLVNRLLVFLAIKFLDSGERRRREMRQETRKK